MTKLSQKLNVPINWDKTLIYSVAGLGTLFLVGLLFKIRVIIAMAEVGAVLLLGALLVGVFISIIRKYLK